MKYIHLPAFMVLVLLSQITFAQQAPVKLYLDGVPNSKPAPATYVESTISSVSAW